MLWWRVLRLPMDSLEQALLAALPLGPQTAAGGVLLPEFLKVSVAGTPMTPARAGGPTTHPESLLTCARMSVRLTIA